MMIITEEQSVVIIYLRKLIKEIDGGFGGMGNRQLRWLFLIVICFVLMLCDIHAIVEKGKGYVVDKMNEECCGLFLILIKI